LTALTVAFDLIRDVRYPDGGRIVDEDVERRIVDNLIAAGCTDMENWDSLSNKGTAVLGLSAAVGRLLEQPERVRRALGGFNRMLEGRYHFDGFYSESPAYAVHNLSNTRELPDLLFGYTDPPGYQPEDGPRLIDHNPFAEGRFRLALESLIRMLAPGNHLPVIGDTHHETRLDLLCADVLAARLGGRYAGVLEAIQGAPLSAKGSEYALWYRPPGLEPEGSAALPLRSEWFPGWHVGVLRGGREKNDTALFLNGNENRWTLRTGHRHHDILSLSFYAFGEELVSDRGYFSGSGYRLKDGRRGQDWVRSAFSHNLVVVDEQDQARRSCGSSLELFGVSPGIEVVQASGVDVYPQCKQYRRTCALVGTLGDPIYAVDIFRVAGGQTHQYGFNCNGSLVSSDRADSAFRPAELSPVWTRWLRNAKAFRPEAPSTFTWQHGDVKLDLLVLNAKESLERVVVADAPGWRRARPAELEKPPIQQVLVENRSSGPDVALSTQYVTLIVPYRGATSPVLSAQLLENDPTSGVVAVEVTLEERTDRVISTLDQQQRRYGPATVAGQFAFCSTDGRSSAVQGYLLNGTQRGA
jgi:hypothetical protein